RGQGRGGVGLLRARSGRGAFRRAGRRAARARGRRAREGVRAGPGAVRIGVAEDAEREDRQACGSREGARRRSGRSLVAGEPGDARRDRGSGPSLARDCPVEPGPWDAYGTTAYYPAAVPDALHGQVALVTGGGRGIGASIARELASAGARVAVAARTRGQVEEVAGEIGGVALEVDVTDRGAVERMVAETESRLGPIDLLAANAGIGN